MNRIATLHTPPTSGNTLISVIIPTLNEASTIATTLEIVLERCSVPQLCEIILVDGGSSDTTLSIVQSYASRLKQHGMELDFLTGVRGRASQMNLGAKHAHGEILLFLHADTRLPPAFDLDIRAALAMKPQGLGAFSLTTDTQTLPLRCICWCANLRARLLALPYGDQTLFMWRNFFMQIKMFPPLEIMEDFALVRQVKCNGGTTHILPAAVVTSARRWHKRGYLFTTLCNQIMILGYYLRIPTTTLARWYRR
ncbi:MAG: TIGR04283 family arsenosugar biosynthesis glycosyltransferase [Desulfuromonadaceae bacterium]|nr:TIGR04283 family arsenosugar biosynthesis glycosyltransferase [Desulfuromonadaceae bacterium]